MTDKLYQAALQKAVKLSAQVEVELNGANSEPLLRVIHLAKEKAIDALAALASVDPEKPAEIRALQNEVIRFGMMAEWIRDMLHRGIEADRELAALQADEARELIFSNEDAAKLGIPIESNHDDA